MDYFIERGREYVSEAFHGQGKKYVPGDAVDTLVHGDDTQRYSGFLFFKHKIRYPRGVISAFNSPSYYVCIKDMKNPNKEKYAWIHKGVFLMVEDYPSRGDFIISYRGDSIL